MTEFEPTNHGVTINAVDSTVNLSEGGAVVVAKATVALNIGDAVFLDPATAGNVTKDSVATNHKNRLGIVVGGTKTYMNAFLGSDAVGLLAAAIDDQVLVQIDGIAWGVADTATVAIGDKLKLGTTTAGRLLDGSDTTDLVAGITGSILAQALTASAAAGDKIKVIIDRG